MIAMDLHCGRVCASAVMLLLAVTQNVGADGLSAGQWKTVQSAEIDGVAGPVQQGARCLTEEAVADLGKTFSPISRTTNSTCERVEHELTPQRLKWRLQCTGQIDMRWRENSTSTVPNITPRSSPRAHSCRGT